MEVGGLDGFGSGHVAGDWGGGIRGESRGGVCGVDEPTG